MTARMICSIRMMVDAALLARQQAENVVDLRMGEAGHRLVGDQQLGIGGHGGELELAHLDLGEVRRRQPICLVGRADEAEQLGAARRDIALAQMRAAPGVAA